jgi:hypothetical protein
MGNQDSLVGIATGYGLDGQGSITSRGKICFCTPQRPDRVWGSPSHLSNGYHGLFSPGVKRPGREAAHSPPSRAEVRNGGAIPPLPYMSSWHSASLIKHRDNYTLIIVVACVIRAFMENKKT